MSLENITKQQLVRMLARNLDNAPSASELGYVVSVYVDDFLDHGLTDDDSDRLQAAFQAVGKEAEKFPTPARIIKAVPKREPPKMLTREITDEERKKNLQHLQDMKVLAGIDKDLDDLAKAHPGGGCVASDEVKKELAEKLKKHRERQE